MKKIISKKSPTNLFQIPRSYKLTKSRKLYYGSLVPSLDVLRDISEIDFVISLDLPKDFDLVEYENDVNSHLFKPRFYEGKEERKLVCYVSSPEVLAHTMRAIAVFLSQMGNTKITVNVFKEDIEIGNYVEDWKISNNMLIGRLASIVNILRYLWLLENTKFSVSELASLSISIENSRLEESCSLSLIEKRVEKKYLAPHNLTLRKIDNELKIKPIIESSPYIKKFDFKYKGSSITTLQLTWGYSLTYSLLNEVLKKNDIYKLAVVGGVGYVGNSHISIDDIFFPDKIVFGSDLEGYQVRNFDNQLLKKGDNQYFNGKQLTVGAIKTVIPSLGVVSNSALFKDGIENNKIDALDMEKEAIYKASSQFPQLKLGSVYYVMDMPILGCRLGDTYYNYDFLKKFFNNFNRGKYFAYERALNYLATK